MRECNAAWAALGSPANRAAYDDELRASGLLPARAHDAASAASVASTMAAGSAAPRSATVVGRVPSPTEHLVEPARDFGIMAPRKSHAGRWVAFGAVVVVVVLGVIAAIAAAQDRDQAPADPELRTNAFEVGSCITILPGQSVVEVPCNQLNAGQIVATTDYPRPCPTGTLTLSLLEDSLNLCLRRT
jgi:hypothetical protein